MFTPFAHQQVAAAIQNASSGIDATLSVAEAGDGMSSTVALTLLVSLSSTVAGDSLSSAASLTALASLSATEAGDTVSATGEPATIQGSLSVSLQGDLLASSGTATAQCSLSQSEAADTATAAVTLTALVQLSSTEAADSVSSSAIVPAVASLTATEAGDAISSTVDLGIQCSLSAVQAGDTISAAGTVAVYVSLANTEAGDTLSGAVNSGVTVIPFGSRTIRAEALTMDALTAGRPMRPPQPVASALGGDASLTTTFADTGLTVNLSRRGWWLISSTLRVDHDVASGDVEARLVCDGSAQAGLIMLGAETPRASIAGQWLYRNKSGAAAKVQARKTIALGSSALKATDSTMSAIWTGA